MILIFTNAYRLKYMSLEIQFGVFRFVLRPGVFAFEQRKRVIDFALPQLDLHLLLDAGRKPIFGRAFRPAAKPSMRGAHFAPPLMNRFSAFAYDFFHRFIR